MAKKAQGTEVYFVDPDGNVVTKITCVTSVTGLTAARDQIETTCLDSPARTYEAGLATPGAAQVTIASDPADASHIRLHELYVAGTSVPWAVGWSDGTAPPTSGDSSGFVLPTTRSWVTFDGYISDFPFEFAQNAMVTSTMAIQVSNFPVWIPKTT